MQSNVTTRIQALEQELGVKLLLRTNRGVSPTPAGKRLLPYAAVVARVLADARQAALDNGTPAGPLTVGTLETTAAMRLSPVMTRYTTTYPDVDLTLRTGTTCELIDQVLDRQLDGAFVCGPVNHSALAEEVFFDEELVVLTAPDVKDLNAYLSRQNLKIIVLRAGCSYRQVLEAVLARRGVVGFRLLELVPHMVFLVDYVARGLGQGIAVGGSYWVLFGVGALVGPLIAGRLADWFGCGPSLRAVLVLHIASAGLLAFDQSTFSLVISSVMVGSAVFIH